MKRNPLGALMPLTLAAVLSACGSEPQPAPAAYKHGEAEGHADEGAVVLSPQQIAEAGIEIVRPTLGGEAGAIEVSAIVEGDPQGVQVASAAVGGRVVSLTRNLGEPVAHGDVLAVIESREAASLKAEVEAARARAALAQSNLRREQRLFAEHVSPEQDLIAARTAAAEANIALRLAQQQVAATGGGGGALNRIAVRAPLSGQVISRTAVLGQTVAADAELFRVADLSRVTIAMALLPADAGRVRPGARVEVTAAGRRQAAQVTFVSPVLDESTRLVRVIATLANGADAGGVQTWRVGETVNASILVPAGNDRTVAVPSTAVQMIEDKPHVFIRTANGFKATPVTLGRTLGGRVIVLSGLAGTERLASTNSFTLKAELGKGEAGHED